MSESLEQFFSPEETLAFVRGEESAISAALNEAIAKDPGNQQGSEEARDVLEALTMATDIVEELVSREGL